MKEGDLTNVLITVKPRSFRRPRRAAPTHRSAHLRPHPVKRSESLAASGPVINIYAPVKVNSNAGTPEQNGDMAKRVSREMETTLEGVEVSEIQRQMRPGICSPTGYGYGYKADRNGRILSVDVCPSEFL